MILDELEAEPRPTVAALEMIFRREAGRRNFSRHVAEAVASGSAALARNGAWLLRRLADAAGRLPPEDWALVVDGLAGVKSWEARLQLCQLLAAHPGLSDAAPAVLADFLRGCAGDPKPFVRAWGVTAFQELGRRHAVYRPEARRWLARARKDPAKSVQARLRHLPPALRPT